MLPDDNFLTFKNVPTFFVSLFFVALVEKCMSSMQMGAQMVKLRGGSRGLVRFFYLDEHKSCIRWRPSRKNEKAKSECVLKVIREHCFTPFMHLQLRIFILQTKRFLSYFMCQASSPYIMFCRCCTESNQEIQKEKGNRCCSSCY